MIAYRDTDASHLEVFANYVKIAESLLDVVADSGARLAGPAGRRGYDSVGVGLVVQRREAWGNLWTQLVEARQIVATMGRDLGAFDAARARAGDMYLVAAGIGRIDRTMIDATAAAIAALRAAVPEVVIPISPSSDYRNPVHYVDWTHREFRWRVLLVLAICFASFVAFVLFVRTCVGS